MAAFNLYAWCIVCAQESLAIIQSVHSLCCLAVIFLSAQVARPEPLAQTFLLVLCQMDQVFLSSTHSIEELDEASSQSSL